MAGRALPERPIQPEQVDGMLPVQGIPCSAITFVGDIPAILKPWDGANTAANLTRTAPK